MNDDVKRWLNDLATDLIAEATRADPSVREGVVLTEGPAPYRRLDCDGRALAYVRARPKKRAVRVDVTGLWAPPSRSRLLVPSTSGAALLVRSEPDRLEAVRFLQKTVERTRARRRGAQDAMDAGVAEDGAKPWRM